MATLSAASGLRLLETGQHSDFTIECQGRYWKVHKIVLGSISPYLDRVCNGDFRESSEARLLLTDEDPVILDVVLKWLYTNTYISPNTGSEKDAGRTPEHQQYQENLRLLKINHLQILVKVYCCADRFLLDDLKHVCITEMNDAFPLLMYTGGSVHVILQQIFENTTSTDLLRSMVLEHCVRLHPKIRDDPLTIAVLKQFEPLCWDIATRLVQENIDVVRQNKSNLTEISRLTKVNDALRKAQATLVQKVSEAEAKRYNTMWRLRSFLRDETVCSKCGCEVTRSKMLLRLLHNQYAIDCQQCRHRVWYALR